MILLLHNKNHFINHYDYSQHKFPFKMVYLYMQKNKWILKPVFPKKTFISLQKELQFSEYLIQLLLQRGINNLEGAKNYFKPSLDDLHDPFLIKDMDKAVDRILKAIKNGEKILIFGDYDVDGTTSIAMMYSFFKEFYNAVDFYVPDRYTEGYGISIKGINYAKNNDISLIISLDCGIKAIDKVDYANSLSIDFIIFDHHIPGRKLPDAVAILDPLRKDCDYPFKYLSGCGVGFKLIQALGKKLLISKEKIYSYLDLVAISIASDLVSITGENRILARYGIEQLMKNPRIGLKVLIPKDGCFQLNVRDIVFSIAPKINAAGRIGHASQAVRLLLSDNETSARVLVSSISELNNQRKELDSSITETAIRQIKESGQENNFTTIVYDDSWHKGVLGIVASRLTEHYYKPTLVFTKVNGEWCASARSVKDFDIYQAIDDCSDLLTKFGGHKFAAGLSLKEENFPIFREKFENIVRKKIQDYQRIPSLDIDLEIPFDAIDTKFICMIIRMSPFGPGNMPPLFLSKNLIYADKHRLIGKDNNHIILSVYQQGSRNIFEAIGFKMGKLVNKFKKISFDMVYFIDENIWQGKSYYRLMIRDVKFHET